MRRNILVVSSSLCLLMPLLVHAETSCIGENSVDIPYEYLGKISEKDWKHDKSLVNMLINLQEVTGQRKGLIYHFCDTILHTRPGVEYDEEDDAKMCFEYDGFRYDPRQSLFMYALCVHTDEITLEASDDSLNKPFIEPKRNYKDKFPLLQKYIVDDYDFNLLREISEDHVCYPSTSMQDCQFSHFLPEIFKNIMNAYSNMKLASLYGYKYLDKNASGKARDDAIQSAVEDFSHSFFSPPSSNDGSRADNECGEEGLRYLSPAMQEGDKKHCSHPKTNEMVAETIKSTQAILDKIDWLKVADIMALPCEPQQRNENLMSCAFSNHGNYFLETDRSSFQNLYLNELLYFSLFIEYYSNQIVDNVTYNSFSVGSYTHKLEKNQQEFITMVNELALHRDATFQMMRLLSQVYVDYPLHVAMMAYLEDLQHYRTELAKLYTPLNQLYYLFRNVQACSD